MITVIHDLATNEIIERDMTAEELAVALADKAAAEQRAQELIEAEAAKQALLNRLGLTADEARLLLS